MLAEETPEMTRPTQHINNPGAREAGEAMHYRDKKNRAPANGTVSMQRTNVYEAFLQDSPSNPRNSGVIMVVMSERERPLLLPLPPPLQHRPISEFNIPLLLPDFCLSALEFLEKRSRFQQRAEECLNV